MAAAIVGDEHRAFRAGDVLHSLADISKAQRLLGYAPTRRIDDGLADTVAWSVAARHHSGEGDPAIA